MLYIYAFLQIPKAIETNEDVILSLWGHLEWGTEGKSARLSPSKARHQLALVVQILLNLLPHVKDGTVPAAKEYIDTVWLGARSVHCAQPLFSGKRAKGDKMQHIVFTLCRAHLRGGNPDNAGTESTGERSAPPVCSGERSAVYYKMSEIHSKG